jgi:hypothetical protein
MIFFDASEVFASLISCPTLNQDKNYFFDCTKDPFVAPQTTSYVGDIHTVCCYRKTYEALIKKFGVDMLLPCIMAMDTTTSTWQGGSRWSPLQSCTVFLITLFAASQLPCASSDTSITAPLSTSLQHPNMIVS